MRVTIEMPKGSIYKYEIDKKSNKLFIDRVLKIAVPHNYGYINLLLSEDGDYTDAFVVGDQRIEPLTDLRFEPHYVIRMQDNGVEDDKYVGCIEGDTPPTFKDILDIIDYLRNYKTGVILGEVINIMGGSP
jgi:inorganic pyrophosphatase